MVGCVHVSMIVLYDDIYVREEDVEVYELIALRTGHDIHDFLTVAIHRCE